MIFSWGFARIFSLMKEGIHPEYNEIVATCVCGAEIPTGSILPSIRVEICSSCHPFFAGTDKVLDTEGRIDKFRSKYGKKAAKK